MSLSSGTKLGIYEILAPLGAGGMGEVYRALDIKLDREVAIKVLPAALAHDPERLARFEREAKVLAALNHPNIAHIYGVEESNNIRSLVMELVPGQILQGPLPLETALRYAKQIAEALEAAHEKGIVHRDLKPANIMVTPEGVVKVLDFGLAATMQPSDAPASDANNSPTLTVRATQAGMIMGTAAYMSPEQAAGKAVDKRTDIWSFGVVLWEVLAGQRLFEGETISHTLADVLRAPIDFEKLPKETPRAIRELLQRCLDRDAKRRLRDIGEARIAIEEALNRPERETEAVSAVLQRRAILPWTIAAIVTTALAALAFVHFREAPPQTPVVNTTLLPPDGTEYDFSNPFALPALSPDGKYVVFGAKPKNGEAQLWLRSLDSPGARLLRDTTGAVFPFWSPDSRWIAFGQQNNQQNKLKKMDILGGPAVTLTDIPGSFRGGSWSSGGIIVFGTNSIEEHSLLRVPAAGGTATPAGIATENGVAYNPTYPWFLPDSRHFLYTSQQAGDIPVRVGSLDEPGKPGKVVAQANSNAVYAQGHLLYLRDRTLMAQPFDPERLETTGEAVPVAEGVPTFPQPSRGAAFTVSAGGLLLYQSVGAVSAQFRVVWKDRQGKTLGNLGEPTSEIASMALSPDGNRLAAEIINLNGTRDIWIYDTARGVPTRFTFDPANDVEPVWSPDGSTVYFASTRLGQSDLFRKPANGASPETLLLRDSATKFAESVSPDGKLLLFRRQAEKTRYDIWLLSLEQAESSGKAEPRVFVQTPFYEGRAKFSPDGHWVAYESGESGRVEVYVVPFPGPGGKRQISSEGGRQPHWRKDGKELFFANRDQQLMTAEVNIGNGTLEVEKVQKLFDGVINGTNTFDVSADGQKFLVVEDSVTSSPPLTLVLNWTAALRR
jgi:eukaryotic-like serine/threonine-protein kinase